MRKFGLSKSKLMNYLQCPKRLYLEIHHPEYAEVSDEAEQAFQTGHEVGEVARALFPGGILIGHDQELKQALRETQEALTRELPIYEATFEHDGVLIRADILLPKGPGHRLVEVKSSTSLKDHYLSDVAVQTWVARNAGLTVEKSEIAHIDNAFVYPGEGRYKGLFHQVDVTRRVRGLMEQVPLWVEESRRVLSGPLPGIAIGKQCKEPNVCPLFNYCAPDDNTEYPVSLLPGIRQNKIADLIEAGYRDLRDVPSDYLNGANHERVRRVTVSGKPELDPDASSIMREFPYPRYYMDFETIQFAIPIWAGTRPYQNVPFQWSCHIETYPDELSHEEFLSSGPDAPMREFAERLIATLRSKGEGPIFVYRQSFEEGRLRELAEMYPDLADDLDLIIGRLVDLLPITKQNYYHPAMMGSWSLKVVLPTIAPDLDYSKLDIIQSGGMAGPAFLETLHPETSAERRDAIIKALREYCRIDTLGMVRIVHFLTDGKS